MIEKIITDNPSEKITVGWDETRFCIMKIVYGNSDSSGVIILNPREMLDIVKFASNLGRED